MFTSALFFAAATWAVGNRWTDVNQDPYKGSQEQALRMMVPYGLPEEAVTPIGSCFKQKSFKKGEIKKGSAGLVMIYGSAPKAMPGVIYDWEKFTGLETEDCEYKEHVVRRALVCNNYLLEKKQPTPVAAITPTPTPAPPVAVTPAPIPTAPAAPDVTTARMISPRPTAPAVQYSMRVNFFRDRPDGHWKKRYDEEKVQGERTAYFRVFTKYPFEQMVQERKDRPVSGGTFYVKFLRTFPKERALLQNPRPEQIVHSETVTINGRGFAFVPIQIPLQQFEVVTIEADQKLADVVERFVWVRATELAAVSNPGNVWFVQSSGVD